MKPIFSHACVSGTAWTCPVKVLFESDSINPRVAIGNAVAYCFGSQLKVRKEDVPEVVCEALAEDAIKRFLDARACDLLEEMGRL